MKVHVWPKATAGRLAAIFCLLFIVLITLKISIQVHLPTPFIAGLGITGFLIGIFSIVKNRDRSLLTLLSVFIGLLIVFWAAAEIIFPH